MRRVLAILVAAALLGLSPTGLSARAEGGPGFGGTDLGASAEGDRYTGTATYIAPNGSGGAEVVLTGRPDCGGCYYEFVIACFVNATPEDDALCAGAIGQCEAQGGGIAYRVGFYAGPNATREARGTICRGGPGGAVTVDDVLAALPVFSQDSMGVPDPRFEIQPAGGALVNLPMIVHADGPGPVAKDFALLGFTVRVTATPVAYDWTFSNGDSFTTTTPGRAYDGTPSGTEGYYVSSTFTERGQATVGLTMRWSGEAVLAGLPPVALPQLTIPGPNRTTDVREARSRLVG